MNSLIGLPRTGQTTSYPAGDATDRDDGHYQAGTRRYATRAAELLDMGDGTVFDRATGLYWCKDYRLIKPGGSGLGTPQGVWSGATTYVAGDMVQGDGDPDSLVYVCILGHTNQQPPNATYWVATPWVTSAAATPAAAVFAWADAIAACEALNYAGYSDWRMPNLLECVSISDASSTTRPLILSPLAAPIAIHWTSTTRAGDTTDANSAEWANTYLAFTVRDKTATYSVIPVRGGRTL